MGNLKTMMPWTLVLFIVLLNVDLSAQERPNIILFITDDQSPIALEEDHVQDSRAFGFNGEINIFDIPAMVNIDRYKRVNVEAGSRDEVFPNGDEMLPENNTGFLKECFRKLRSVKLAEQYTGEVYAWIEQGAAVAVNPAALNRALKTADVREALSAVMPSLMDEQESLEQRREVLDSNDPHTLGAWGGRA